MKSEHETDRIGVFVLGAMRVYLLQAVLTTMKLHQGIQRAGNKGRDGLSRRNIKGRPFWSKVWVLTTNHPERLT